MIHDWDDVKMIKSTYKKGVAVQFAGDGLNILGPRLEVLEVITRGQRGTVMGLKTTREGSNRFTDIIVQWEGGTTLTHSVQNLALV